MFFLSWTVSTAKGLIRDRWRRLRRAAHEGLNVRVSGNYQPLQENEAAALVANLLQNPDAWDDHLKR